MMKQLLCKLMICLLPFSGWAGEGFVIKGKIHNMVSGSAWIELNKSTKGLHVLPEKVRIVNGEFTLTGKMEHPERVRFWISTKKIDLFLENAAYTIDVDFSSLNEDAIKGGAMHAQFWNFTNNLTGLGVASYLKQHNDQEITSYLADVYAAHTYDSMVNFYSLLGDRSKGNYYGRKLKARIDELSQSRAGAKAPDFTITTPDGKKLSLHQFAGKIVVIDFWASWCGPCRVFIPKLKELHVTYKDKDVVFLSISLDANGGNWKKAMEEEKMEWLQGLADGAFEADKGMRKLFGFASIPYLVVISPDGNIAASLDAYQKQTLETEIRKFLK